MSHDYYNTEWQEAQTLLKSTLQREPQQQPDRREERPLLSELYLRYTLIANKLADCVDQVIQPQKRKLVRKLLEATLGRVLELKTDLVEADLCEWTFCGDEVNLLKLTTFHTELKIPRCFRMERREELESRKATIERVLDKLGFLEPVVVKRPMTDIEAVLFIQSHERARQGRLRAQFMKEIRQMKEKTKPLAADGSADEDESGRLSLSAALRIQKLWRGFIARRMTRKRKVQEMLLIGMIPQAKTKPSLDVVRDEEVKEMRRYLQEVRQNEMEEAAHQCRDRLEKHQRGPILEQLSDQVRGWIGEYRAHTGKIPEYTGSERSVSRLMISRQGTDSELSKSTPVSSSSKSKKTKSPKEKESKTTEEQEDETTSKAIVSSFLPELNARNEEYDEVWKIREDGSDPAQSYITEMLEQQQLSEFENELRKVVDELMKNELQMLQEAWDRDRGHKGKKKSSKKARRGGKKSKKKKEKDLTPDRTTESLFEELVANGIIKRYPEVTLDDFIGERSHCGPASHNNGKEKPVALGDFRQLVTEYCILPLLSDSLHQSTPITRSLLIAGSRGSGKDMLVNAICTEAGAVLFDLTPANIVGKYPGKSGLTMLIHLVNKVSRLLQPSVIYMDGAEKPFVKKIPKGDKTDPKRLRKDLPRIIKGICPEDRVMLIGVSSCPWDCDQKLLQQVYQRFIMIPKPDYASRYAVWRHLLGQYSAISWQFDTSGMTKITDGFTVGCLVKSFGEVMTCKRMLQLRVHPLNPAELINVLCQKVPIYKEEEEAFNLWWTKTPMARRRQRAIEKRLEEEAEELAKSNKGK